MSSLFTVPIYMYERKQNQQMYIVYIYLVLWSCETFHFQPLQSAADSEWAPDHWRNIPPQSLVQPRHGWQLVVCVGSRPHVHGCSLELSSHEGSCKFPPRIKYFHMSNHSHKYAIFSNHILFGYRIYYQVNSNIPFYIIEPRYQWHFRQCGFCSTIYTMCTSTVCVCVFRKCLLQTRHETSSTGRGLTQQPPICMWSICIYTYIRAIATFISATKCKADT